MMNQLKMMVKTAKTYQEMIKKAMIVKLNLKKSKTVFGV